MQHYPRSIIMGARSHRTIQAHSAAIRITESGSGDSACVFLHYWGGSGRTWDDVIDRIDGRARCVAFDQRGWGDSIATDGRYDLAALADDVQGIVAALGLQRRERGEPGRHRHARPE
jgi:pimeloyl-ACP methyl ester carboxylesterase